MPETRRAAGKKRNWTSSYVRRALRTCGVVLLGGCHTLTRGLQSAVGVLGRLPCRAATPAPTYEEGLSESDDDKPQRAARVFSRDLDADDAELDDDHRAGVSVRGRDGRMVGAHLSTVNLYAGSPARAPPAEHKQQAAAAAAPAPVAEAPRARRRERQHRGKSPEPDDGGEAGGEDGGDVEDVAAMRARMRARLKKNKKGA